MIFDSLEKAIDDIKAGKMIILVDDADRENEGDLCCAAEKVTPEIINFMAKHGRGLICLSITSEVNTRLGLWPMTAQNTSNYGTNFTVSIEAAKGVTTGISAADRAHTILTAIHEKATAQSVKFFLFYLKKLLQSFTPKSPQTEGFILDIARKAARARIEFFKNTYASSFLR